MNRKRFNWRRPYGARRARRGPIDRLTGSLPDPWRSIADWALTIAIAVGVVLLIKAYVINPYRIPSPSMEPTFHCAGETGCEAGTSDRIIANRFIYHFTSPKRGDIVVFTTPPAAERFCKIGGTYVKRIIGLPGETVELRAGRVLIDRIPLAEPYIQPGRQAVDDVPPTTIPHGTYFVLGDNRRLSCDSRLWGSVPRDNIIGKAFMRYWPLRRISVF